LRFAGIKPIIVHGGGPNITEELKNRKIVTKFVDGMRVTDKDTLEVVEKELNKLNNELRDRLRNSKERNEQQTIVERAKEVANKYKLLKSQMKISKEIMGEFKFMKKVRSVDDLKKGHEDM